jgi:hypothetical protein
MEPEGSLTLSQVPARCKWILVITKWSFNRSSYVEDSCGYPEKAVANKRKVFFPPILGLDEVLTTHRQNLRCYEIFQKAPDLKYLASVLDYSL